MHLIQDTQPFIDLNLYTVPLNGKHIKRNELGKKHGYSFTTNWQEVHSTSRNELATPIGGLLTGKSGIVAIDCDCKASYDLFRQLDPSNTAYFDSIGKLDPQGNLILCGTILYSHAEGLPPSKKLKGTLDLDWFNGTGMVFLPTAPNETKSAWQTDGKGLYNHKGELVTISPMPPVVKQVLELTLQTPPPAKEATAVDHTNRPSKGYLGKLLEQYDFKDIMEEYEPSITRLLTPKEYRTDLYQKQGHIHPKDVGARHDYLFKIMCQLAGDNTVDKELARDAIMWINSLLDPPRSSKQMEAEIIGGIVSGRQKNPQGEPYWEYDEHWELNRSWTAVSKSEGDLLHVFYDKEHLAYFVYNTVTDDIKQFTKKTGLVEYIQATTIGTFNQKEVISDMSVIDTLVDPTTSFGYLDNDKQFNLFKPTKALQILHNPSMHEMDYREPIEFIGFINHMIPEEQQRNYFLSLIRTKLTTFKYSPVVPYIIGVQGSGKGILMTILANFMGNKYAGQEVKADLFMSQFNYWLENQYFVNLNELGGSLGGRKEKDLANSILKLYTGAEHFLCHRKGIDPYTAPMKAMFIMTANSNPLDVTDDDRRIYYIKTPNSFITNPMCKASTSSSDIYKAIMNQMDDIAYWLNKEVKNLSDNDYTTAPNHVGRDEIIFDNKPLIEKTIWALYKGKFQFLVDLYPDPDPIFEHREQGRIYLKSLVDVYEDIGSADNADKLFRAKMKEAGYNQHQSTGNSVFWNIKDLADFKYRPMRQTDTEAEEIQLKTRMRT